MFAITIALIIIVLILYLLKTTIKTGNLPPGPPWLPLVGNLPLIKKLCQKYGSQHLALEHLRQQYKTDALTLKYGTETFVMLFSQDLIKEMLSARPFQGRPDNFFIRMRTNGKRAGVTMTDGEIWTEHRHFLVKHLRDLGLGKNSMEQMILEEFSQFENHLDNQILKEIYLSQNVSGSVLNVLWYLVAGYKFDTESEKLNKILNLMKQRGKAFQITGGVLGFFPFLRHIIPRQIGYTLLKSLSDQLYVLIFETIEVHKSHIREEHGSETFIPRDFIDAFIVEMNKGKETYTDDQLLAICLDMFIAGSETTTNTLDFALLNMVLYPEIQEKVQGCIDLVLGPNEKPTYALKMKLPYIEAVLQETQRLYYVIPLSGPHRATEPGSLGGYHIPKDTLLVASFYSIHHSPDIWGDPETFRPERFLNPDGSFKYCETLYSFGYGKRRCLGETLAKSFLFIYFVGILHRYKITSNDPNISDKPIPGITLSPKPYKVILESRLKKNKAAVMSGVTHRGGRKSTFFRIQASRSHQIRYIHESQEKFSLP